MTSHPSSGWRRTVGAQWSSVNRQGSGTAPPGMQQGFHSSYLNAISRPDIDPDFLQRPQQQQQQQQQYEQQEQLQNNYNQLPPTTCPPENHLHSAPKINSKSSFHPPLTDTQNEHQRALQQFQENQRQQQLYHQQLQLMQRLQAMPGSTTRPWYPTFGPSITTSCSDNTIQLDNPNQFTLINNAKLNRNAVGPHWRSIQTSTAYSPTPSPPSSSPMLQSYPFATSSVSSRLSSTSTTPALHAFLSTTYSSAASIDHARATSFHSDDQALKAMSEKKETLQLVHQEYYQSHSYPHDPRHLLQQNNPSSSREARENTPVTSRTAIGVNSLNKSVAKRKAAWEDGEDEDSNSSVPTARVFDSSQNAPDPSDLSTDQSSIHQFVPLGVLTAEHTRTEPQASFSQDHEMNGADTHMYTQSSCATYNSASNNLDSMDQDDTNFSSQPSTYNNWPTSTGEPKQPKRTKQRLDWPAYGTESLAEARRRQSGEQVRDIFQECFYNAAASASR